ncbi:MAG: DUF1080 domain-containing protein [Planctomycetes bacterium]|nr:DUF1080 domain-containing protein [Planctomycetota bacterium]
MISSFLAFSLALVAVPQDPALSLAPRAQGEYLLELSALPARPKVGAQLLARGGSSFELVLWSGGLPGAGGQREGREIVRGLAEGEEIRFAHERGELRWKGGKLHARMTGWSEALVFERVERVSPTLGLPAPKGAIQLFGKDANDFVEDREPKSAAKIDADGNLEQGATSKTLHGDALVHVEFRTPFEPGDQGQGRGNSGVYLQGRYEVQVLDSFGLEGKHDECGGIYSVRPPDTNACFPPGSWQTYDIEFRAARFDADGQPVAPARLTVFLNGIKIHDDAACPRITTAAPVAEKPELGPLYLQDHGDAVRYRNVWVLPRA